MLNHSTLWVHHVTESIKILEPCGQKELTQQQSQTKKKPIISTTLLQLFNFLIIYLFLQELILCGLRSICKIYSNQNPQNFVCLTVWKFVTYMIKKHSTVGYTVPVYSVKIRTMSTLISTVFWKIENKIRLVLFL